MIAYFSAPGPIELLVLGLICVAPLAAIVIVLVALRVGKQSPPPHPPCPKCGGWTVPGTKFCPHCGNPIP